MPPYFACIFCLAVPHEHTRSDTVSQHRRSHASRTHPTETFTRRCRQRHLCMVHSKVWETATRVSLRSRTQQASVGLGNTKVRVLEGLFRHRREPLGKPYAHTVQRGGDADVKSRVSIINRVSLNSTTTLISIPTEPLWISRARNDYPSRHPTGTSRTARRVSSPVATMYNVIPLSRNTKICVLAAKAKKQQQ